MTYQKLTDDLSVAGQINPNDIAKLSAAGFKSIISNRPDGEGSDQPSFAEIETTAKENGIAARYIPVTTGTVTDEDAAKFSVVMSELPKPILAYCRTGTRSTTLWALAEADKRPMSDILSRAKDAGYDMSGIVRRITSAEEVRTDTPVDKYTVVIIGGGAAGAAVATSLLRRMSDINIAIIEPSDTHYYQPGWTLVGGGVFSAKQTAKRMAAVLPKRATWIKAAVAGFEPEKNQVVIEGCRTISYDRLIVCPGLKLAWNAIEGLTETLGKNGVTSNYRYDLAPYTWELVQGLKSGRAIFTQPPMPIKCAGAPQKAMYLSGDHWFRTKRLADIDISFHNAAGVLFAVSEYVPALMEYIRKYNINLEFGHSLISVDGPSKTARFEKTLQDGTKETIETQFDLLHVCPPQLAPDFIRASELADAAGWVDVDPQSLQHKKYDNIYGLGDVTNTPNAKTAAAARKQAPIVAENILESLGFRDTRYVYDGYGSCPLTVERGKVVLAEFLYGGKVSSTFPSALFDGKKPTRAAWILKARLLPPIYWKVMLKGREWLAKPKVMA
ncbi:MAG: TIGR01244 family sulfur transferase [Hyphomicrobiaceae bacterium]